MLSVSLHPATEHVELALTSGPVRGFERAGVRTFLDIPYAAAPTGRLRFSAPTPHPPWTETRDATKPGPTAPQPDRSRFGRLDVSPFFEPGWVRGEDYLTLNVWAPPPPPPGERAPILLWVHGGAFVAGSNRAPVYDGAAFAASGVIAINVNYRLGVSGFLRLPDAPDNRGLLDVVAALRWVRDNATALGGDPNRITLAGQSAGAIIVASVLASEDADGLFRRAIVQSGSGEAAFSEAQADRVTQALAQQLMCSPTAAAISAISDDLLVEALTGLAGLDLTTDERPHPVGGIVLVGPVAEHPPVQALLDRTQPPSADLLIGSNSDEAALYLVQQPTLSTDEDLAEAVGRFAPNAGQLTRAYRASRPTATRDELRNAIATDAMFGNGTRRLADAHSAAGGTTYAYEFTCASAALDGRLGACHLMEVPFVFSNVELSALHGPEALLGPTPPPDDLAERVHDAWVRFISNGDPGWAAYATSRPLVQTIGESWIQDRGPSVAQLRS